MPLVVGIRFKSSGKVYYFDPVDYNLNLQDTVIVDTVRGQEVGYVAQIPMQLPEEKVTSPLRKVVRLATENDRLKAEANQKRAHEAIGKAMEKVELHGLDMRIVDAEYAFDLSKVIFFFTSEGRVDFRDLVKDLASIFRTRVELRQIGVRDKAKMVGGLGCCGRSLCCATFLADFEPVSIKMAKEQSLSLNPLKISGVCGRLMCCLKYENEVYKERNREAKAAAKQRTQEGLKEGEQGSCPNCRCGGSGHEGNACSPEKSQNGLENQPPEAKPSSTFEKRETASAEKNVDDRKKTFSKPRKKETGIVEKQPQDSGEKIGLDEKRKRSRPRPPRKDNSDDRSKKDGEKVSDSLGKDKEQILVQKPEHGLNRLDGKKRRNDHRKRNQPEVENGNIAEQKSTKKEDSGRREEIQIGMKVLTPEGNGKVINMRLEDRQATVFLENKSILEFSFHLLKKQ